MEYEAVIGLEVHVQIKTKSKMFASVGYSFGEPPNTLTDPVVWALPGVLPVINRDAVKKSDLDALANLGITASGYMEAEGIKVRNGKLYLGFASRDSKTDGSKCRANIFQYSKVE